MSKVAKADYKDLIDVWWETARVLEALPGADDTHVGWHSSIFEKILVQCGWTVEEWNEAVETDKLKVKGKN